MAVTEPRARRAALVIVAKAPRPGSVKTRLCPPLAPEEAAELSRCFLLDTIARVASMDGVTPVLAYAPVDARPFFERAGPGFALLPQPPGDLGVRLTTTFERLFAQGFDGVVAIGADAPTLPTAFLRRAVELVTRSGFDVVLGPSADGGYYLIGLGRSQPALFTGVPWSTRGVFGATVERAQAAGLALACLPPWYDVDTRDDLARLRAALRGPEGVAAAHTRRFFAGQITGAAWPA